MWQLWETDSQEEQESQYSNNESSDGILVLASDSQESAISIVHKPSPSVQGPGIIAGASHTLLAFSSSCSDTSSLLGKYFMSIL